MNPISLNPDVIQHIGSYLNPGQAVAFTQVNKSIRANSDELLRQQFRDTFGEIDSAYQPDKTVMARYLCFCCVEKDSNAGEVFFANKLMPPSRGFERWKWLAGVENSFDKKIQEDYDRNIRLLENTSAISITQLKHKMIVYCLTYLPTKWSLIYRRCQVAHLNRISKIFFICLRFFLRLFCKPSFTNKKREPEEPFAKIGGFHCDGKDYDVVVLPSFVIEVGIVKRVELLAKEKPLADLVWQQSLFFHVQEGTEKRACLNGCLPMIIKNRLLYQKLIQIMCEMTMQNKKIVQVRGANVDLKREDFTKRNVSYSGGAPESWLEIIQREPILKPSAAKLPYEERRQICELSGLCLRAWERAISSKFS